MLDGGSFMWPLRFQQIGSRGTIPCTKGQPMPNTLEPPEFKNEEEEALWWEKYQSLLLKEFKQASEDGSVGRGTLMRRKGQAPTITIRLDPTDIELARVQAEDRGLRYQTYLKMVLHQALVQEAGRYEAGPNHRVDGRCIGPDAFVFRTDCLRDSRHTGDDEAGQV
jgi:predicted DNA binding CopG/RHH family protein